MFLGHNFYCFYSNLRFVWLRFLNLFSDMLCYKWSWQCVCPGGYLRALHVGVRWFWKYLFQNTQPELSGRVSDSIATWCVCHTGQSHQRIFGWRKQQCFKYAGLPERNWPAFALLVLPKRAHFSKQHQTWLRSRYLTDWLACKNKPIDWYKCSIKFVRRLPRCSRPNCGQSDLV